MCNLIAIYIFGFPRKVRKPLSSEQIEIKEVDKKISELEINENTYNDKIYCKKLTKWIHYRKLGIKNFIKEIKFVLNNLPFVFLCVASATEGLLLKGFLNFISLFFQYQYELSSSTSTIITGGIAIFSVIVGSLSGAHIITKYKFNAAKCTLFVTIIYLVTSFSFWFLVISCPELSFIDSSSVQHRACKNCNCANIFDPVCLLINNQIYEYQSACHAGCKNMVSTGIYSNCSCLYSNTNNLLTSQYNATVSYNFCDNSIKCLGIMIAGFSIAFFIVFLTSIALIPHLRAIIQTIDSKKQSFALGLRLAIIRVIGNFTGPIIFGAVIDSACIIWKINCFNQKRCELYSNKQISLYLATMGFSCRFSSCLFCFMAFLILKYREPSEPNEKPDNVETIIDNNQSNEENKCSVGTKIQNRSQTNGNCELNRCSIGNRIDFDNDFKRIYNLNVDNHLHNDILYNSKIYVLTSV